jgi:hypothetical protein
VNAATGTGVASPHNPAAAASCGSRASMECHMPIFAPVRNEASRVVAVACNTTR